MSKLKNKYIFIKKHLIFVLIFIFFVSYSALAIGKHSRFETAAADLGIYTQSVWHYSRFEAPFSSIKNLNQLGDHFTPTLALFTPFYWIFPSAISLLIAQSLIVVIGVLPIWWFAKEKLGIGAGLIISFAYLFFVGIQSGIDFNLHPEVIAATWIGFSIYFLLKKNFFWYFVFLFLALGSKEDIPLIFLGLGFHALIVRKWYAIGVYTLLISLIWFYLSTSILMPYFSRTQIEFLNLTPKATGFLSALFSHPFELFKNLTSPFYKIETILTLFGSFAFLPLFSGLAWLAAPATFINRFVSNDWSRWSTHFQYSATIAPLLALSTVLGIENLKAILKKVEFKKLKIICLLAILVGTFWANRPGWDPPFITPPLQQIFKRSFWVLSENQKLAHQIIRTIPAQAFVATNTFYVPHLINREKIFEFPNVWENPDIYFLSTLDPYPFKSQEEFDKEIQKIRNNPKYKLFLEENGLLLFTLQSGKI